MPIYTQTIYRWMSSLDIASFIYIDGVCVCVCLTLTESGTLHSVRLSIFFCIYPLYFPPEESRLGFPGFQKLRLGLKDQKTPTGIGDQGSGTRMTTLE